MNETLEVEYDHKLTLKIEPQPAGGVVVCVSDKEQLLGRLFITADEVVIFQPNEVKGKVIEWVGLP